MIHLIILDIRQFSGVGSESSLGAVLSTDLDILVGKNALDIRDLDGYWRNNDL